MAQNRKRGGFFLSGPGGGPSLTSGGGIFFAFLAVVIGGSFLLTGGNPLPQRQLTDPPDGVYEIDEESLTPDGGRANLQLRTIKFKECGEQTTIVLMLDKSGSMKDLTPSGVRKIDRLKEAVNSLASSLSDESVIGIQAFSSPLGNDIRTLIPVSYFRDVRDQVEPAVNSLFPLGTTPTHDALAYSYTQLQQALPQFPDRQFNYVFISDGQPVPGRGQPGNQDPRDYNPNPADQIKALGVTTYTLGIYDPTQNKAALSALLKDIASSPDNYYEATTADDTEALLQAISSKICGSAE